MTVAENKRKASERGEVDDETHDLKKAKMNGEKHEESGVEDENEDESDNEESIKKHHTESGKKQKNGGTKQSGEDTGNEDDHDSEADKKDGETKDSRNEDDEEDEDDEDEADEEAEGEEPADKDDEEKKTIVSFDFDGYTYTYKEKPSVLEEREGKIEFRVVNNDNTRDNMIILTGLKNVFQKQLPEMPKAYIARLVYDRSHISIAVVRKPYLQVVGGITWRPFESREFAEIVFCAISSTEQVRGYGAHMMNHFKDYVRNTSQVKYYLTYADNYAIGYFKKQGFTKDITLPKKTWMGYIKDYEGGTLMQCSMLPHIRYLDSPKILTLQKAAILRKIRSISQSHVVRPGLKHFLTKNAKPLNPLDIPAIREAGWAKDMDDLAQKPRRGPHHVAMVTLLTELQNHPSSWPFTTAVNRDEVPDYYQVIKEPMDLSTMEIKLESNAYENFEDFIYDCKLIFNNCRSYNNETTTFYKNATKLEKVLAAKLKDFPEFSSYIDMLDNK